MLVDKGHFCCLFFMAAEAYQFLDKFLVWKINFCTRPTGVPWLWQQGMRVTADSLRLRQQGMHEIEKVSGSGSRACMKLRKSQALAAGHA